MKRKNPKQKQLAKLVDIWLSGNYTKIQNAVIEEYFNIFSTEKDVLEGCSGEVLDELRQKMKREIDLKIGRTGKFRYPTYLSYFIPAAVILVVMGISFWLYHPNSLLKKNVRVDMAYDVLPGKNIAVLTRGDGTKVFLDSTMNKSVSDGNSKITVYSNAGRLDYQQNGQVGDRAIYNSLETPRGGQYQVTLSDGTHVWLNAASVLTYPVAFNKKERSVSLTGEAYFEVNEDKNRPFLVVCKSEEVKVTGTHFNISTYPSENVTKTTLLTGRISVIELKTHVERTIYPGQQLVIDCSGDNQTHVRSIDSNSAIAWKEGYFLFDDERLEDILKEVARWYDVEIIYQSEQTKKIRFSGSISKYSNVSKVIQKLELTDVVHFKLEGRRLMVKH